MKSEREIYADYKAELAVICALDRSYYLNVCPTRADRSNYYTRQDHLKEIRSRFYPELAAVRRRNLRQFCRRLVRTGHYVDVVLRS